MSDTVSPPVPNLGGTRWNDFPSAGSRTAPAFFTGTMPLLQGVLDTARDVDNDVLIDQIAATLSLGTRESTLPLVVGAETGQANRELAVQAAAIGQQIVDWTVQALDRLSTERIALPAGPLAVRSRCDGHLLTHQAADMLLGSRGGPVPMQMYNEWLHQMVLLRDALLPFTNWDQVPLHVTPTGLRHLDAHRERFLAEAVLRQLRHTSLVSFARQVVTGSSGPAGYGFSHDGDTVLPAVLDTSPCHAPAYLLTWRPTQPTRTSGMITYVNDLPDYYAAARTAVDELPPTDPATAVGNVRIEYGPVVDGTGTAWIQIERASDILRVDLGQALRGHRFAHRQQPQRTDSPTAANPPTDGQAGTGAVRAVEVGQVLAAADLVWAQAGDVVIDATDQDPAVVLAVLGRLYPENVVLRPVGDQDAVVTAGWSDRGRVIVDVRDGDPTSIGSLTGPVS